MPLTNKSQKFFKYIFSCFFLCVAFFHLACQTGSPVLERWAQFRIKCSMKIRFYINLIRTMVWNIFIKCL